MKIDHTNWQILEYLQENGRLSYAEIGKLVGLTAPAVTERMRKLEDAGIITGYHAHVDPEALGLSLMGMVTIQNTKAYSARIAKLARETPEVLSCDAVTGSNNYILRVVATTRYHLREVLEHFLACGATTSSVVLDRPVVHKPLRKQATSFEPPL